MQILEPSRDPKSGLVSATYMDELAEDGPEWRRWEFEITGEKTYVERLFARVDGGWGPLAEWRFQRAPPSGGRLRGKDSHFPLALSHFRHDTRLMAESNDERRYSEDEFALVLRMASEIGDGPEATPPREGLTLAQIREIAGEVGIDPERVSRAAALLPSTEGSGLNRLLGGSPRHRLEHTVSGVVPSGELGRIIEVARRAVSIQGVTHEVMGGLEWTGSTGTASFGASITPLEDTTTLQVWTDRTESMAGIYGGVGMGVLGAVALTMSKLVVGETDAGIVVALLSGLPPAFLCARTLWKRSTKKYRERLLGLLDAMAGGVEVALEGSRGSEGLDGRDGLNGLNGLEGLEGGGSQGEEPKDEASRG